MVGLLSKVKVEAEVKQADSEKTRMEKVTSEGLDDAEDALSGLSGENCRPIVSFAPPVIAIFSPR